MENIQKRMSAALVETGLTRTAIAERSGQFTPGISTIIRGKRLPSVALAERILNAVGYDLVIVKRE